jgi:hypothetical protein
VVLTDARQSLVQISTPAFLAPAHDDAGGIVPAYATKSVEPSSTSDANEIGSVSGVTEPVPAGT